MSKLNPGYLIGKLVNGVGHAKDALKTIPSHLADGFQEARSQKTVDNSVKNGKSDEKQPREQRSQSRKRST